MSLAMYAGSPLPALEMAHRGFAPILRCLTVLLMAGWCCGTSLRAAAGVSRERDQRTLDSLLTLPIDRKEILVAKWVGSVVRFRYWGYGLALFWACGVATFVLHPLGVMMLALTCSAHVAFLTSVGVWVSVGSARRGAALAAMGVVLFLTLGGPWIVYLLCVMARDPVTGWTAWVAEVVTWGLNPTATWWTAGLTWLDFKELVEEPEALLDLAATLLGAGLYAGGAWYFWSQAVRRFDSIGRRV
jgi:hypothetical protein